MSCRIDPASRKWIQDHKGTISPVTREIHIDKRRLAAIDYRRGPCGGEVILPVPTIDAKKDYRIVTDL